MNRGWAKTGKWTRGRKVGLKRLYEGKNLSFLTPQDMRIRNAIQIERWGAHHYSLRLDKAMPELVDHPHVFRLASPTSRVRGPEWPTPN